MVSALRGQSGYREIAHERITFGDFEALYWEFEVDESGRLLHKVDVIFINQYDEVVAILTQAPADEWGQWAASFEEIRNSLILPG